MNFAKRPFWPVSQPKDEDSGCSKGELRESIGHKLRTPLTGIIGMLELVLETDVSTSQRLELEAALASANSLRSIMAELLDSSEGETPQSSVSPSPLSLGESGRHLCVLLVEDNTINQNLLLHLLEQRGYSVVLAEDGNKAIDAWRKGSFDLILMDLMMQNLGGLAATARIREEERAGRKDRIPIIAVTANVTQEDRAECTAAGLDGYVPKPIRTKVFMAEIERVLSGKGEAA